MINVKHIQYHVGQGGLHLGVIGDYAYIYDCGGYGKNVAWKKIFEKIKAKVAGCKKLYIFISHWHEDHYKKIDDLLNNVAPLRFPIFIYSTSTGQNNIKTSNLEKIMYICENMQNNRNYLSKRYARLVINTDFSKWKNVSYERDFSKLPKEFDNTILKPYITHLKQSEYDELFADIREEAKNSDIKDKPNVDDLILNLRSTIENKNFWAICLNAYKKFTNKLKEKTQESKKTVNHRIMLCLYCGQVTCADEKIYESWLHTGDAVMINDEDIDGFKHRYGALLDNVTNFQIPHHGSMNNHNSEFPNGLSNGCKSFFITAQSDPKSTKKFVKPYLNNIDLYPDKSITQYFETSTPTLITPIGAKHAK